MFRSVVCLLFLPFILDAQPRTGRDFAVFFYVTDFQPGIDDIPFTKGEAEELAAELGSNYGFSCAFVRECKKDSIIAALKEWNKILGPNDQVLFFFSMHGHYDASSDRGFLIPADGKKDDQDYNTWLSYDDLRTQIGRCKAGHILVALDACFSGSFGIPSYKNMPTGNDALFAPDCITRVNNVLQIKGRQFLTAGRKDEKTPQRSLLVAEFLSTLRKGYDIEGLIFFEDMAYQLHKIKNPEPEDGSFIGHKSGGDFVFVRKNGCYNFKEYTNEYKSDITGNCTEFANNINSCPTLKNLISDIEYWHYCNAKNQIEEYESYIKKFPNGQFAEFAKHKIEKLSVFRTSERDWETTLTQNTIDEYKAYAKKWPHQHVDDIKQKILAREQVIFDLEMIPIEGGEFLMGNTESNKPDSTEMPHKVIVPDFRLGKYEVTYEQWKGVMGKLPQNVSYYFNDPDYKHSYRPDTCSLCPIASISYWELKKFIDKLNLKYPGKQYRLPTEAEWEYAAKGGKSRPQISIEGAITKNSTNNSKKIGLSSPNALNLYDMNGNVYEWCSDWYDPTYYKISPMNNPNGPATGTKKVTRGGCNYQNSKCRITYRGNFDPKAASSEIGLRLAMNPK